MMTLSLALAEGYRQLGVREGDRIACSISNRPQMILALAAAWLCRAIPICIDHESTASELLRVLALTTPRVLLRELTDDEAIQRVSHQFADLRIVVVGDVPSLGASIGFADLVHRGVELASALTHVSNPSPQDPAAIFITSGTTGIPKAPMGFHGNLAWRWQRLAGWLEFCPEDIHFAQMPLSHGFGLMMAMSALLSGGRLILSNGFSAQDALRTVAEQRVTILNGAPAHFSMITRCLEHRRHDVRSLRLSVGATAPFPRPLVRAIRHQLGVQLAIVYGSSEGIGVATKDECDIELGSVGRPAPGSVAIVGPDRRPVADGRTGEIAFSLNAFPVRYWHLSSPATSAVSGSGADDHRSGWYYSGDLGRLDAEGRLYVLGRLNHQINRGGLKVDPLEVEDALLRCPGVVDAAVIGLPNPILGETVCACVSLAPGETLPLDRLRRFLSRKLAPYKRPEELYILARIPRTNVGRVDLGRLRSEVQAIPRKRFVRW